MTAATQIEAGPETDRQVAEACGFHRLARGEYVDPRTVCYAADGNGTGVTLWLEGEDSKGTLFRPSTDWNDAMLAAERFGLFADLCCLLGSGGADWFVGTSSEMAYALALAPTGPLAICRAILALNREGK